MVTQVSDDLKRHIKAGLRARRGINDELTNLLTLLKGQPSNANSTITVGDDAGTTITCTGQLKDAEGDDCTEVHLVYVWLSSDAAGETPSASEATAVIGTDGSIIETHTTDQSWTIMTEADGDFDIVITEAGVDDYYIHMALPNGQVVHGSQQLSFS